MHAAGAAQCGMSAMTRHNQQPTYPASAGDSPPRRVAAWRRGTQPKATTVGTTAVPFRIASAAASSCTPSTTAMSQAAQLSWKLCSSPRPCSAAERCFQCERHALVCAALRQGSSMRGMCMTAVQRALQGRVCHTSHLQSTVSDANQHRRRPEDAQCQPATGCQ